MTMDDELTINDVCRICKVDRRTVTNWRTRGRNNRLLKWGWSGRIVVRRADLEAFCRAVGRQMGCEPAGVGTLQM